MNRLTGSRLAAHSKTGLLVGCLVVMAGCRPVIEFKASTEAISSNQDVTLTWSVEFARGSASRDITISPTSLTDDVTEEEGEMEIKNLTKTTTFKLRAKANVLGFPVTAQERVTITVDDAIETFVFNIGDNFWTPGFSGFNASDESEVAGSGVIETVSVDNKNTTVLTLKGTNPGDNLFMFAAREYPNASGKVLPNTEYKVGIEVSYATEALKGCATDSNDPGNVWLKFGAFAEAPEVTTVDDIQTLNLDKGPVSSSGEDLLMISQASISANGECNNPVVQRNTLSNLTNPQTVRTGDDGKLWLVVGFDTSFKDDELAFHLIHVKVKIE